MAKRKKRVSITRKIMNVVIDIQNEKTPHDLTRKTYIRNTKRFVVFCREKYNCKDYDSCREHIQDYSDYLQKSGDFTPSTIHTYIASVCSSFDVPMSEIKKPIRHIGDFTRGREEVLHHTNQDLNAPEYKRIVEFQKIVGIRRNELKNLTGDCLVYDDFGNPAIWVKKGKGSKEQFQRLNKPEDIDIIKTYFEGKEPGEKIFTDKDLNNDLNFHYLRALSAKEYYDILLDRILNEPGFACDLMIEIEAYWNKQNINKKTGKPKPFDRSKLEGWYVTRGSVRQNAIRNKRPIKYNRLAVFAVSFWKLSHFRTNVTVENYLSI